MGALTFKRGVHPHDFKESTRDQQIRIINPNTLLYFPVVQHLGIPCVPIVKKGDLVKVGTKIADHEGYVSSPIHSSVSGVVKDIKPVRHSNGVMVNTIIVENDGAYTEEVFTPFDFKQVNMRDAFFKAIKEGGIVGMGGATFPTHVKLNTPPEKKVEFVIVNGAECEPYLTSDHRVMLEQTERVIQGLVSVLKVHPDAKGIIGIENNKKDAISKLQEVAKNYPGIEVVALKTKYPQGAEKQLIYAVTKREVPDGGGLPIDVGAIVINVDTAVAIQRVMYRGRPLMRRIITVAGGAIKQPSNLQVKLGMTYREVIEAAGGFVNEPVKVLSGGPMMGQAIFDLDIPVIKGTSAILCLTEDELFESTESNCIRCRKCVEGCPIGLLPLQLDQFSRNKEEERFLNFKGISCIECGICSFVCPSKRHLTQTIRVAKRKAMAKKMLKK